jgi:hypothetical protein
MSEPSYQELLAQREKEWATAQAKAAADLKALHTAIARMPDVTGGPAIGSTWGAPGVICGKLCGSEVFAVTRYVTVNGLAHRLEGRCLGCQHVGTWDFASKIWID